MESLRVLIVDDLPSVRQGLAALLRLASGQGAPAIEIVGEAQDGREALRLAQELRPDVALMDVEMPGMDGLTATRALKALLPQLRVIIVSIHTGAEARQQAQAAGADGFITKGENYTVLLQAIRAGRTETKPVQPD